MRPEALREQRECNREEAHGGNRLFPPCYFLAAARFSLRRSLSVFCGAFFWSFFGFSAPFISTSQPSHDPPAD